MKVANGLNLPHLALIGGHGAITTVKSVHRGVDIWMKNLDSVEIALDGSTATAGGGALTKADIDTLWTAGKQTSEPVKPYDPLGEFSFYAPVVIR